jgi:hypothetical protein
MEEKNTEVEKTRNTWATVWLWIRYSKPDEWNPVKSWRLGDSWRFGSFLVKLPKENEFVRYDWIRFEPDWGAFIEGKLSDEK